MKKEKIIYYAGVIFCGFYHALEGTLAAAMICSSILLFVSVASDYGYLAILDFLFGIVALVVAIVLMCHMGKRVLHRGGNFCKEVRK